jgi:glycosyltransferase involved in cell wall biosynthesis
VTLADQITVLLITYNEESNIARTLAAVAWAKTILVVDSGSTDATRAIIARFPQASIVERPFDTFATQCNFGLSRVTTDWVLSLDADYELSEPLAREIQALRSVPDFAGYRASFVYRIFGRALTSTLYPPRTVLYRKEHARYRDEGHGHRVVIEGKVGQLRNVIFHDDRKPLARWLVAQQGYARREADYLLTTEPGLLSRIDRVRRRGLLAPILVPLYTLLWKRCLLDGWPGWYYALQRTLAEVMIALEIIDRRLGGVDRNAGERQEKRKLPGHRDRHEDAAS